MMKVICTAWREIFHIYEDQKQLQGPHSFPLGKNYLSSYPSHQTKCNHQVLGLLEEVIKDLTWSSWICHVILKSDLIPK